MKQLDDYKILWRHPDDLKIYVRDHPELTPENKNSEFIYTPSPTREEDIGDQGSYFTEVPIQEYTETNDDQIPHLRKTTRSKTLNRRYFNEDFVHADVAHE